MALLHFDPASLPAGDVVAVELHIWTGTSAGDELEEMGTAHVYRMIESWDAADATWNERASGVPWTTVGAGPGSRADVVIGSFMPGTNDTEWIVTLPPMLVNAWRMAPASNYGIQLDNESTNDHGVGYDSLEWSESAKRPGLAKGDMSPVS